MFDTGMKLKNRFEKFFSQLISKPQKHDDLYREKSIYAFFRISRLIHLYVVIFCVVVFYLKWQLSALLMNQINIGLYGKILHTFTDHFLLFSIVLFYYFHIRIRDFKSNDEYSFLPLDRTVIAKKIGNLLNECILIYAAVYAILCVRYPIVSIPNNTSTPLENFIDFSYVFVDSIIILFFAKYLFFYFKLRYAFIFPYLIIEEILILFLAPVYKFFASLNLFAEVTLIV